MTALDLIFFILLLIAVISYSIAGKEIYGRIILIYLVLIVVTSIAAIYVLVFLKLRNNLFIFHIFTPIQYLILSLLYSHEIANPSIKRIINYSIPFFIVLSILFSIFVQKLTDTNSIITIIESIGLITWPLLFLKQTLEMQRVRSLLTFPMFWISVGLLFYFVGTLITEGMLDYLIKHDMEIAKKVFLFTYIFKYMLFIMLSIGAWCNTLFLQGPKKTYQ
jgi:hypothetical protein